MAFAFAETRVFARCGILGTIFVYRLVLAVCALIAVVPVKASPNHEPYTFSNNVDPLSLDSETFLYNSSSILDTKFNKSTYANASDTTAQEVLTSLNTSVDPCDNFYAFACQGWQKQNPRPKYIDEWSVFSKAEKQISEIVVDILHEPVSPSDIPALSSAKRYFRKCIQAQTNMDPTKENADMEFIWNKLEEYGGWPILYKNGTWNDSRFDWIESVVGLKKEFGLTEILAVSSHQSLKGNVSYNSILIQNPSAAASLLNPTSNQKKKALTLLRAYTDFIANVSRELLSFKGASDIDETYNLNVSATEILMVQVLLEELEDQTARTATKRDFRFKWLQVILDSWQAEIDLEILLRRFYAGTGVSIKLNQPVTVSNISYLLRVAKLISLLDTKALANFLHFQMVFQMIPLTNVGKLHEHLNTLQKALDGTSAKFPSDQVCAKIVEKKFPFTLGHAFVKRIDEKLDVPFLSELNQGNSSSVDNFPKVRKMFDNIKQHLSELASHSDKPYIDKYSKSLITLVTDICPGYPPWITQESRVQSEYAKLNLSTSLSSYMEQTIVINTWAANKQLAELTIPGKITGCKWSRFPGTIGAFHQIFEVYVPFGMLQIPFYDEKFPQSLNYGKLGTIIGHELGHGIVGNGWSAFSNGTNTPLGECIANQYSNYSFVNIGMNAVNLTVDGNLTLTENLADNVGLLAAYKAYKANFSLDSKHQMTELKEYSNDQLFFIGFAQNWCETATEEALRTSLRNDAHSPGEFRVLGTLQNSNEFAQAWKCPVGSKMNPEPTNGKVKCALF